MALNVTGIIDAFGGYREAQTLLGVSRSLLAEWEIKGIPPKRWPQIAELAKLLNKPGITIESLSCAAPSKTPRAEAA